MKPWNFLFLGRNYDLSTLLERNTMLLAKLNHAADSLHRKPSFSRPWLVIEPAVKHSAVVSGLMAPRPTFFLEQKQPKPRESLKKAKGRCETYNAASDDCDFSFHG